MRSRWASETCPRNYSTSRPNDSSRWQRRRIPILANWVKIKSRSPASITFLSISLNPATLPDRPPMVELSCKSCAGWL